MSRDLERSVNRFISVHGYDGQGKYQTAKTIEECYETLDLYKEKPDIEFFTEKVNEYLLIVKMEKIRKKRDELLSTSDWTQMNDVKLEDDAAWKAYRQSLRDLPSVVDLEKIVYPLKPGEKVEVAPEVEVEPEVVEEPEIVKEDIVVGEKSEAK
jgi:hypothetical protein